MSRAADRAAALREARNRRAELRLFTAARRYAATLDVAAVDPSREAYGASTEALAELEAAALRFAAVTPAPARRRRRRS